MSKICYTLSNKKGHVLRCERDENGLCVKNCQHVRLETIHPRIAIELKRLANAIEKYDG